MTTSCYDCGTSSVGACYRHPKTVTIPGSVSPAQSGHPWENHDDSCECHIGICMDCGCTNEYTGAAPAPDGVRPDPDPIDDAMQYALAFMNDPEGLAGTREEWRDRLRAALQMYRAASPSEPGVRPEDYEAALRAEHVRLLSFAGMVADFCNDPSVVREANRILAGESDES